MMMIVKMMMLNWVYDILVKVDVLFLVEFIEKIVCRVVGVNVLFIIGVGIDVVKEVLEIKMVEFLGVGIIIFENKNRE